MKLYPLHSSGLDCNWRISACISGLSLQLSWIESSRLVLIVDKNKVASSTVGTPDKASDALFSLPFLFQFQSQNCIRLAIPYVVTLYVVVVQAKTSMLSNQFEP